MGWKKAYSMIALQRRKKSKQKDSCESTHSQESVKPNATISPSHEEVILNSNSNDKEIVIPPENDNILKYEQLHAALQNLKLKTDTQATNILYTHPNVRIYFISPGGTVKATSESDILSIVELQDGVERPTAYLQVGDWIYPLVPGVSPCLKTEYGAFILPDLHSPEEGATVGIILPEEANASVHELLNDILHATAEAPPSAIPLKRTSHKRCNKSFSISQKMIKGAQFISHGMISGAEKAGRFMNNRTPKLMQNIEPKETPASINPKVESGLKVAKNVSQGAATVTSYIVSRVDVASSAIGHYLAPRIHRKGTQLLSTTFNYSEQRASKKVDNAFLVAAGAVGGVATVFGGLINAAGILAQSLTTNTVKIVQHKYGEPAGAVTSETFHVAGNVFVAGTNIMHMTPHGLLEVAAAEMSLALVEDYRELLEDSCENSHKKVELSSKED